VLWARDPLRKFLTKSAAATFRNLLRVAVKRPNRLYS
jgi:hypothetical protein